VPPETQSNFQISNGGSNEDIGCRTGSFQQSSVLDHKSVSLTEKRLVHIVYHPDIMSIILLK
jgi:hypothetical protein